KLERRALRPAILLITDGLPTDPPGEFEAGLGTLTSTAAGRASPRVAGGIRPGGHPRPLTRVRRPGAPTLGADRPRDSVDRPGAASIAVSRRSEEGADREALAQTLMPPPTSPGPVPPDDSIL